MGRGTLFIIGNGFDLAHKLKTSPDVFYRFAGDFYIREAGASLQSQFDYCAIDWNDFEKSLAEIDLSALTEDYYEWPDYTSDHESDRDDTILHMESYLSSISTGIAWCLERMIDEADNTVERLCASSASNYSAPISGFPLGFLGQNDLVVTFNYTSTIEDLYHVPKGVEVLHVHGCRRHCDDLVVGYGEPLDTTTREIRAILSESSADAFADGDSFVDRDYYVDAQRTAVLDFYHSLKKDYALDKLTHYLDGSPEIREVVVLGHSMSTIDKCYFDYIERRIKPARWRIWQFNGNPSVSAMRKYSFFDRVTFFDSKDFSIWPNIIYT